MKNKNIGSDFDDFLIDEGMLEEVTAVAVKRVSSLREIAAQEGVDNSYVSRMMNLTVLAPDIVEAILDDSLPDHLTLFDIAVDPPALWEEQSRFWL